ncbi:hypothetical protein ACIP98_35580 [Streptomyces sp. NPDC088354]|uniref:hypothetical protein n=1 Tax=unclassified Streptomyces TaxID=2593676 RepID=UPI0029BB8C0A|nr:hypothetical protein [Streptomyces sp. MI02-7b]MDX3074950.1 hypothetical protein [Streptomyces sp. MI02-7b]
MNDSREHEEWMDAALVERLLDGADVAQSDDRVVALVRVLTAAAGPAPGNPEHERAALAAFREARDAYREGALRTASWRTRPSWRGRRSGQKTSRQRRAKAVIGGAAAVFVLGGVAIAAQTGTLPGPLHPGPGTPTRVPSATSSGAGTATAHPRATSGPDPATALPRTSRRTSPATTHPGAAPGTPPAAALKGLCESYAKAADHGKSQESSSKARLEWAAGGKGEVAAYCARLTGTAAGNGGGTTHAAPPSHPAGPKTPPPGGPK